MRIIHFADLHIGVELYGRPLPERGWSSRMQDFLDAFDYLVEYALRERADAVIFAGDAYKAREPSQTHQREFARRIRRLSEAGTAVFLLVGNHDLPNAEGRAHALEIFRTLDVPGVTVGDNQWFERHGYVPQVLQTRSGPLQVAFLPWPQVSKIVGATPELARLPIPQLNCVVEQRLGSIINRQAAALDPMVPAILTCHVSVDDTLVRFNHGSEQQMTVGTSGPVIGRDALQEESFDYIALGHHHNQIELTRNTPAFYSGSMQAVDFGEEAQPKGFMVADLDPSLPPGQRVTRTEFVTVPARRFVTIDCHPSNADPTDEVCARIGQACVSDAIVKVDVHMTRDQGARFRQPEARRLLENAHYLAGFRTIYPDDRRTRTTGCEQPDAGAPHESLDLFLKLRGVDDGRRNRLLAAAGDLILEVEGSHA